MTDHNVPAVPESNGLPQPPPPDFTNNPSRHRPPPPGFNVRPTAPIAVEQPAATGVFAPSHFRGVLCGIAGAFAGAALWYALVVLTDRQFVYVAVGLGLAVGYSVSWGAAKRGAVTAIISAIIGALAVLGAYYYINRHLIIASGEALDISYDIPMIPTFDELKIVLRIGYEADGSQYAFTGLCVAAAAWFGFKGIHTSRAYTGKQLPR